MRSHVPRLAVCCPAIAALLLGFAPRAKAQDATHAKAQDATHALKLELTSDDATRPFPPKILEPAPAREITAPAATWKVARIRDVPVARQNRTVFFLTSSAVYGIAFLDMHETMSLRPYLIEHDPLARPFTRLPEPAYYACGFGLTTAVNLVAWRMMRSARWHSVWWLPQAGSIAGNDWGYSSTLGRLSATSSSREAGPH